MPIALQRKQNCLRTAFDGEMPAESAGGGAANRGANGYNSAKKFGNAAAIPRAPCDGCAAVIAAASSVSYCIIYH
jgi:hypothetical protein